MADDECQIMITLIMVTLFIGILGMLIGVDISAEMNDISQTEPLGQMVCDERGHGEFVKFEKDEKRIVCEPQEDIEQYDGGFVVVRR